MPNAKLGAKVDRYSFFVRLLPPLLHTGLARRTNISFTLKPPAGDKGLLPDPEQDNSSLRHCDRLRVVENTQIVVSPQVANVNRTAKPRIFESQSEWFGFIVANIVEEGYCLRAIA